MRCLIDDVLVFGKNQEEHDVRLRAVMEKLQKHGVTLSFLKIRLFSLAIKLMKGEFKLTPQKHKQLRK